MSRDTSMEPVQAEYERLRAEQPNLSHKELWRRAEQRVLSGDAVIRYVPPGSIQGIQSEYARLRATHPDLSHKELWDRAKQAAANNSPSVDGPRRQHDDPIPARLSRQVVVGFVLMCVATGLAGIALIWSVGRPSDFTDSNVGALVWLSALLLGPAALGMLISARNRINMYPGADIEREFIGVGLAVAAVGTAAAAYVTFFVVVLSSSGL